MAKTLNFEKILSASLLVSKVPRDVFVEQVSKQLSDLPAVGSLSGEELSKALAELNLEATTKDFLASLFSSAHSGDETCSNDSPSAEAAAAAAAAAEIKADLSTKIDSLKGSIDRLNMNIEKLIKQ